MDDLETLAARIEQIRQELHKKAEDRGMSHPEVLAASEMLNALLNEYEKLSRSKIKKL